MNRRRWTTKQMAITGLLGAWVGTMLMAWPETRPPHFHVWGPPSNEGISEGWALRQCEGCDARLPVRL